MIKVSYDSKDEVPEKFAELYSEKDGKFVLSGVDGIKTQDDVDKVQEALRKERELKKAAEAKLTAYDGIEADGLREQLDELARLRTTGGKVEDDEIEKIVSERLKLDKAKHEREVEKLTNQLTQAQEERTNLVNEKNKSLVERKLREVASPLVNEAAMNDVLFRASIFEVTEDGSVVTKEGVGVTPGQDPAAWLDETIKTNTHWTKTTKGAGARGNSGKGAAPVQSGERPSYSQIMEDSGVKFN